MKLRSKALILVLAVFTCTILSLLVLWSVIISAGFAKAEEARALDQVKGAERILVQEIDGLAVTTRDWAIWDDTYAFIQDRNENYKKSNLNEDSLGTIKVNLAIYLDVTGKPVFAHAFGENVKNPTALVQHLLALLSGQIMLSIKDKTKDLQGILDLPEGDFFFALEPILPSSGQGAPRGALVFGRFVGQDKGKQLSELLLFPVKLYDFQAAEQQPQLQKAIASLAHKSQYISTQDNHSKAAYLLIRDVNGKPAFLLRADTSGALYQRGRTSMIYSLIALAIVGLIFSLITMSLMDKIVLSRLSRLHSSVSSIGTSGALEAHITLPGNDEISGLAQAINHMLENLGASEAALHQNEEKLQNMLSIVSDWVWEVSVDGLFTYASPRVKEILGYDPEEVVGRRPGEFLSPEEDERFNKMLLPTIMERKPFAFFETVNLHKDGHAVVMQISGIPVFAPDGTFKGQIGMGRDITEHKRQEEALHDSQARLLALADEQQILLNNTRDFLYRHNPQGVFTYISPSIEQITGHPVGDWLSHYTTFLSDNPINDEAIRHTEEALSTGKESPPYLLEVYHKDGRRVMFEVSERPYFEHDKVAGIIGMGRDITQRKELEAELERRNQELQGYIYTISHDLRTPLVSMDAFAKLLSDEYRASLDARGLDYLRRLHANVQMLNHLLDDLAEFSSIGRLEEAKESIDVAELINETLAELAKVIEASGARITLIGDFPTVRYPHFRLHQIFSNLIANAIEYSREGAMPEIEIGCSRLEREYRFHVKDNGIGIEEHYLHQVFDIFSRLRKKEVEGTGMGLAIVKRVVEEQGGTVGLYSQSGQGSTFWFTIPFSLVKSERRDENAEPALTASH